VPQLELIPWLLDADVAIVPFIVNDVTLACSPLKVFEYIGAHLPVVSTLPSQISSYPLVRTSSTIEEALIGLDQMSRQSLTEEELEAASAFIDRNTWAVRMAELDAALEHLV
jgi:hypothetical protein